MTAPLEKQGFKTARGTTLLVLSAVAFSTAGFFAREAPINLWAMIFWRNLFGTVALAFVVALGSRDTPRYQWRIGAQQWGIIAFGTFGTVTYLAAFKYTSVANISIIYAVAPLITAAVSWFWLREKMAYRTLIASIVALSGVSLTVVHSLQIGTVFGDSLALLMTISLSFMAVAARGNKVPALVMSLLASGTAALIVLPLGYIQGANFFITATDAFWLAGFGIVTIAIALPCYLAGASQVAAGRGMLISALEMPLAPLWVWLTFKEVPAMATMLGGFLVASSIFYELRKNSPSLKSKSEMQDTAVDRAVRKALAEARGPRPVGD